MFYPPSIFSDNCAVLRGKDLFVPLVDLGDHGVVDNVVLDRLNHGFGDLLCVRSAKLCIHHPLSNSPYLVEPVVQHDEARVRVPEYALVDDALDHAQVEELLKVVVQADQLHRSVEKKYRKHSWKNTSPPLTCATTPSSTSGKS